TFAVKLARPSTTIRPPKMIAVTNGKLPPNAHRLYVLAAADGDQKATFRIGGRPVDVTIQDRTGFIGQWDDRTWNRHEETLPPRPDAPPDAPPRKRTVLEYTGMIPGFIKRASIDSFSVDKSYTY